MSAAVSCQLSPVLMAGPIITLTRAAGFVSPEALARRLPSLQADLQRDAELKLQAFRLVEDLHATRVALDEQTALASKLVVQVANLEQDKARGDKALLDKEKQMHDMEQEFEYRIALLKHRLTTSAAKHEDAMVGLADELAMWKAMASNATTVTGALPA